MKRVLTLAALAAAMTVGCVDEGSAPGGGGGAGGDPDQGGPPIGDMDVDAGCTPSGEVCDGQDNDCDGTTDEGFALGEACNATVGSCTSAGTWVCADDQMGARCDAPPPEMTDERCDGLDNDCDGQVDETYDLATDVEHCGACDAACALDNAENGCEAAQCVIAACLAGFVDADGDAANGCECAATGDETCNGLDDDCDGQIDEGLGLGEACGLGVGACAAVGERVCGDDGLVVCDAVEGEPGVESCNGYDDDCDGTTDEGFDPDGDGFVACDVDCDAPCPDGVDCDVVCAQRDCAPDDPAVYPGAFEICEDGVDQNCDGNDISCSVPAGRIDTISVAEGRAPGCRDVDGDGDIDNAFGNALLTGTVNPQLQQSVDDRDLNLVPITPGLSPPGQNGLFDFAVVYGQPDDADPAAIRIDPEALDENGLPVMLFPGTEVAGGALDAGPGTFLLNIRNGGQEAELRIRETVVTGDLSVEDAGVRIGNGWVTGYVTEEDFQTALTIVPEEFRALIPIFIQADIDTDGDGRPDAYSACVRYTAVPVTLLGYPAN